MEPTPPYGAGDALNEKPIEALRAAAVARRYFLEGRTKSQIADEFSISRFKVARLIEWAQEVGIVRVEITAPAALDAELGLQLERRFGLESALVLAGGALRGPAIADQIGPVLASAIAEVLETDDVLGVGWGRTIDAAANSLPALAACPVVQLIGATNSGDASANSAEIVRKFSARSGGAAFQLHAPFFVSDPNIAGALRREPLISTTLAMFPSVTKAVLGIGSWDPAESGYTSSIPRTDRDELRRRGTAADVCALLLDADGGQIDDGIEARTIAMTERELRAVPTTIVAAGGASKAKAILATLRSGLPTVLVTDTAAASGVLGMADRSSLSVR